MPVGGVHSTATFVVPGGDPSNPADIIQQLQVPPITLASQGVWNHVPYAITGGFALISIQHTGPHPAVIRPYVPEPSSALLALVGSTGLLGYVRRRRRS